MCSFVYSLFLQIKYACYVSAISMIHHFLAWKNTYIERKIERHNRKEKNERDRQTNRDEKRERTKMAFVIARDYNIFKSPFTTLNRIDWITF